MTITIADILRKIEDDLARRGTQDEAATVFTREQAQYLHDWALMLIHERDELVAEKERIAAIEAEVAEVLKG